MNYLFKVKECYLRNGFVSRYEYFLRCLLMIKEIATAKYIFVNEASNVISTCPIRRETKVIQLWHGCGAFKKFGFSTADLIFGDDRKNQIRYPSYKNYDLVTVSSPEVIWAYAEAMQLEQNKEIIKPLGISRTDIFFDDNILQQARKKLYQLIPAAKNKKVVLYAPTFRGRVADAQAPDKLDYNLMKEKLDEEYILLVKHHPLVKKRPEIPGNCAKFVFDITEQMTIEDAMCVADICISDYSSLIFEYSLLERPMLFFAYDIEEYIDWRGFYYPYEEFTPGPVVNTTEEIVRYLLHTELFDLEKARLFKEKFMISCDGHSTERILQEVFGEELKRYKKNS